MVPFARRPKRGNDGLTDEQRAEYLRRWERTYAARPPMPQSPAGGDVEALDGAGVMHRSID